MQMVFMVSAYLGKGGGSKYAYNHNLRHIISSLSHPKYELVTSLLRPGESASSEYAPGI